MEDKNSNKNRDKQSLSDEQKSAYCLDKAIEIFRYDQQIPVLELAKQIQQFLGIIHSTNNIT